jgi:excisionase family DNA binding protein
VLTVKEAARRLGCSAQYARRLLRQGRLRGVKAGRDWAVDEGDVDRLIASMTTASLFPGRIPRRRRNRAGRGLPGGKT